MTARNPIVPPNFASMAARFSTAHFSNAARPTATRQYTMPGNQFCEMKDKIAKNQQTKLQKPVQCVKSRLHEGCAQYQSSSLFARRRKQQQLPPS